jgi:hypothetical protein
VWANERYLGADNSGEGVVENVLEAPPGEGAALQILDGLDLVGQLLACATPS